MTPEEGPVLRRVRRELEGGPLHMTLLDPASTGPREGVDIAKTAADFGTHAFMVGGSTGVTPENLDALVHGIKEATQLPVIHFPSSAGAMSLHVDAIYFMSTLNSASRRYLVGEQLVGAPLIHAMGMEAIGLGYVIVEPGMTVGKVSEAELVPRDPHGADQAVSYALLAQYFGMPLVYLEAGSGADAPVPTSHVRAVSDAASIPLLVGGGIRGASDASAILDADASILVTGTIAENGEFDGLEGVIGEVHARRDR